MTSIYSNHHLESAPRKRTFAGDLLGATYLAARETSHLDQLEKNNVVASEYDRLIAHETKTEKITWDASENRHKNTGTSTAER
jgi:hypothetical protein